LLAFGGDMMTKPLIRKDGYFEAQWMKRSPPHPSLPPLGPPVGTYFSRRKDILVFAMVSKMLFPTMLDRFNWERVLNEYLNEGRNTVRSLEVQINLLW